MFFVCAGYLFKDLLHVRMRSSGMATIFEYMKVFLVTYIGEEAVFVEDT